MQRYIFKQGKITIQDAVLNSSRERGISASEFGVLIIVKHRPELPNHIESETKAQTSETQNDSSKNQQL